MNEPSITYFYATNTSSRIAGVAFEPVDVFAGSLVGVFATDDPALIAELSKLPHVETIDKERYDAELKKKAPVLRELRHSNKPLSPPVSLKEVVGVVVENQSKPATALAADDLLTPRPIEEVQSGKRKK